MLRAMICPTCFNRSFHLRFSKNKQAPFFRCGNCCTNLFVRTKAGVMCVLSWCEAIEKLNKNELRGFLASGLNSFRLLSQEAPQLSQWEQTEAAQEMTLEDVIHE